jgi:gas vesicle protein
MAQNDTKQTGMSPLGAALVGAAVGAAAVIFAKKENRDKVTQAFEDVKTNGEKKLKEIGSKAEEVAEEGREKLSETLEEAKDRVDRKPAPRRPKA